MTLVLKVEKQAAPLRQQVVNNIRCAITAGHLKPKDRIVERELCESLGVSRTLVRESLRQLETEGLIEVIANKGPIVASLTEKETREIYAVREVLEAMASRLFTRHATTQQVEELQSTFELFIQSSQDDDPKKAFNIQTQFYQMILEGCDNEILQKQLTQIYARTSLLRSITLASTGRLSQTCNEIEVIMAAISDRDEKGAWEASALHVELASKAMLQTFSNE